MPERFAIYFAPATTDPLWQRAAMWLGRDPSTGKVHDSPVAGLDRDLLAAHSASARRYGFHATIKAPMALAEGMTGADLRAALAEFAAATPPVELPQIAAASLDGGFLALIATPQPQALDAFAAAVVSHFDRFRAPLSAADRARRNLAAMTPRQLELLDLYGYPYVFEEFMFHMTLTDRLPPDLQPAVGAAAAQWFAPNLAAPLAVDRLALFHEAAPGAPFTRIADFVLEGVPR